MKQNNSILSGMIVFLFIGAVFGPIIYNEPLNAQPTSTMIEIVNSDQNGITLSFSLPMYDLLETIIEGNTYQQICIPGAGETEVIGLPAIPVFRNTLCIPDDATSLEVSIKSIHTTYEHCFDIMPVQPPSFETSIPDDFVIEESFYTSDTNYPTTIVELSDQQYWRDLQIITLTINPIQFNPSSDILTIYDSLVIEISYISNGFTSKTVSKDLSKVYDSIILNYENIPLEIPTAMSSQKDTDYQYLAIADPQLESAIAPLVNWRDNKGLHAYLVNTTITGNTNTQIKNYISTFYSSNPNLEYVLLVGDISLLPWYSGWGVTGSDYWYGDVTGDIYPELSVGRITATTPEEATQQVTKILRYEMNPASGDWFDKVLLAAHKENAPGKYVGCSETIRTTTYTDSYIFDTAYGHEGPTNQNVSDRVNVGRNILNYRGHGDTDEWCGGWTNAEYNGYTNDYAHNLLNENRTPIHYCIACNCGDLSSYSECLGEAFIKDNNSAVAFLGATEPSYTDPNHIFDQKLFQASGNDDIYTIGLISNYANSALIDLYGTSSYYLDNVKMYIWLGDPAMEIWTEVPQTFTVTHPNSLLPGTSQYQVEVMDNGTAVEDALVCISNNDDIHLWGYTNDQGIILFNVTISTFGNMNITVTKHNYLPYQQMILIPAETELTAAWNFVSTPANHDLEKENIVVEYNASFYNWTEATTSSNPTGSPLVDADIIGWNRNQQVYENVDCLQPGQGYWIYCYHDITLLLQCLKTAPSLTVTTVDENWNLISNPSAIDVLKSETLISYNGSLYNWTEAFNMGLSDNNIYGYNRASKIYENSDVFASCEAYWVYCYEACTIQRESI
jgi:gingipain R